MVRGVTLIVVALLAAGCSQFATDGISFVHDDRLQITHPADGSEIRLPVTVEWEDAGPDGGTYVVVVDRSPQPPGESPAWFARDDEACDADDGCPDAGYLARRGVYITADTEIVLEVLPRVRSGRDRGGLHSIVVVVLDGEGKRRGEEAASIDIEVSIDG